MGCRAEGDWGMVLNGLRLVPLLWRAGLPEEEEGMVDTLNDKRKQKGCEAKSGGRLGRVKRTSAFSENETTCGNQGFLCLPSSRRMLRTSRLGKTM
jgi:hypothetical protein